MYKRQLINGIKVEIQGTEPFEPTDLDGLTDKQILYVGSHRYALESATEITLVAEDGGAQATIPIATPGAIVAMKLHAIEDRRPSGGMDKRAGDAWDIYRILLDLDRDGSVRRELATLQQPLRQAVAEAGGRILVDRAARTVSWLKAGDERMARVIVDDLRSLAEPALEALGR